MRKSSNELIIGLLVTVAAALLCLYAFQSAWLTAISRMLSSNPSNGLPVSSTPVTGFSFPTAGAPASLNKELTVGDVGITVTRVISPADKYMGTAGLSSVPREGKEYLVVDIEVRCISSKEKCHVIEFDFAVETKSGEAYPAELSGMYSDDVQGVFEGGEIELGKSMSGSLIFIIQKGESGLTLIYPRMFAFGGSAKFLLTK